MLMYVTAPITWPIAKCLDLILGEHECVRYNNMELKEILELHRKKKLSQQHGEVEENTGLDDTQLNIMHGAMNLGELRINDIYTPISKVLPVYLDTAFNYETLKMISETGYSRVPVALSVEYPYIIGILLVKRILMNEVTYSTLGEMYRNG